MRDVFSHADGGAVVTGTKGPEFSRPLAARFAADGDLMWLSAFTGLSGESLSVPAGSPARLEIASPRSGC